MRTSMPLVSVVVPVYNCNCFFSRNIDSLLSQTFRSFEVIIVDDGSTDGTYELAQQYASEHDNIFAYQQQHSFAGAARNYGLSKAKGDYVLFLDGDDYFEPTLLEHSYKRALETDADVCVFGAKWLNNKTGEIKPMDHACRADLCPTSGTFNRCTNPRYIFCFTTPAPWTKLYKRSFIEKNNLLFQETRSANDLRFTFTSLAIADKIAVLDEKLVIYRRENDSSLQSTQGKDPLSFYKALIALRQELIERGVFADIHHAFVNASLDMCMYNLRTLKNTPDAQRRVFDFLKSEGFSALELEGKSHDYFYIYPPSRFQDFSIAENGSYEDYARHLSSNMASGQGSSLRKLIRSIIPLRASVFENSKRDLQRELDEIKEQNRNLSDKLTLCLEELHKNPAE